MVREFLTASGVNPYRRWLEGLDPSVAQRVQARVFRFETGNLGDVKNFKDGVFEARLAFGPGYRLYFGRDGLSSALILLGGEKSTQSRDIQSAKRYWKDYLEREHA